ncbi:MAG: BrnT family toxin [Polaromonas sp.]
MFAGLHFTGQHTRQEYDENRFITVGLLDARLVVLAWTPRGEVRRIISMRKANDREKTFYTRHLD